MPELVVFQVDADEWTGMEADVSRRSVRVRQGFRLTPPSGGATEPDAKLVEWLKGELHRLGIHGRHVRLVLPREELLVRKLDLPPVPDDQLASVVRYQAAATSPSAEPVLLDFLPLPARADESGRSVLTVATAKDRVEKLRNVIHAAGSHLDAVTVSPVSIAELVVQAEARRGDDPQLPSLAVMRHGRRLEIDVIYQQRLCMTHAVDIEPEDDQTGGRAVAETHRLLVSGGSLLDGKRIARVWMLDAAGDDRLGAAIAQRLQCEARSFNPFGGDVQAITGPASGGLGPMYAGCAGALLQAGECTVESLDFLHPRQPPVPKNYRKIRLVAGAGAALLLALLVFGSIQLWKMSLNHRIAEREQALSDINGFLTRGEPTLKAAGEIEAWEAQKKVEWAREMGRLNDMLDTRVLYFTEMHVEPAAGASRARIRVSGVAQQDADVYAFSGRLSSAGYAALPPTIKPNETNAEFPLQFDLSFELSAPAGAAVKSATRGTRPVAAPRGA